MKNFLLSLSILLTTVGMGANAQGETGSTTPTPITEVNQLNNQSAYTIQSVSRGYLYYDAKNGDFVTSSSHTNITNATPNNNGNTPTEQFGFLRGTDTPEGEYYLYNMGAGKFVTYSGSGVALELKDTPDSKWTVEKNDDKFTIKVPGTRQTYINITNWEAQYGCKVTSTGPDDGNRMTITNVCTADFADAVRKIKLAEAKALVKEGIGYPKTTSAAYTALKNLSETATEEEINNAITQYYACTDIELPVSGKAYTINAWWKNKQLPVTFFATTTANVFTGQVPGYAPNSTANAQATKFVCKQIDNKYIFASEDGYYFGWQAEGKPSYTSQTYADNQQFEIKKAYIDQNNGDAKGRVTEKELLGKVCLQNNATSEGIQNLMFSCGDKTYHNGVASSTYYDDNGNTVYYTIKEVTDGSCTTNVVKVNANANLDNAYLSTFYAPYATVVPDGCTAYTINSVKNAENKAVMTPIPGSDIPACTGVVIKSNQSGNLTLQLSTQNPAYITGNLLKGSVTDSCVVTTNAYVLSKGSNGTGLYRPEGNKNADGAAGTTHFKNNAGKAYLVAPSSAAKVLSFGFDDGTTGIEETETSVENAKAVIYDLCGRRVSKAGKGLYIINGKKVIR